MTEALGEVLAQIDDPETVQQVLAELSDTHAKSTFSCHSTLSGQYKRYLERRRNRSPATIAQYKRTIPPFVRFAAYQRVLSPDNLTTVLTDDYVNHLFEEHDADATICTYAKNVRAWLRWLHKRGLCDETVYRILDKEELGLSPEARDEAIPAADAMSLLDKLHQQRRGTAQHALLELVYNAGPRIGEVHSLDLSDFDPSSHDLSIRHRPATGTRIKNGDANDASPGDGERDIILHPRAVDALTSYIKTNRHEITDEYGREPLFAAHGRAARSTLRRWIYEATSCRWAINQSSEINCDGSCNPDSNVCPHSYYPHAIRRGAIVSHLSNGLRPDRAAERFDVSIKVIREHYDPRSKSRRKDDRADAVREAWNNGL